MIAETPAPEITGTDARVTVDWVLDVHLKPGSVPDRPLRSGRTGVMYRPDRLHLEFQLTGTGQARLDLLDLLDSDPESAIFAGQDAISLLARFALGSESMTAGGRNRTVLKDAVIAGFRVRKDGAVSKSRYDEHFYARLDDAPDWVLPLVQAAQAYLDGTVQP
jgi:hypothetical protein